MTGSKWHLVSPIAEGGSISAFIQEADNAIPVNGSNYGMMNYDEGTNAWKAYFTTATVGNLTSGAGYGIRRSSDGAVTFSGTLTSGTKSVALVKSGEGWNLVGNPYSSAINMNNDADETYNFLTENSANLEGSYAAIYVWDDGGKVYKILNNSSGSNSRDLAIDVFAPGQAFFVKAASDEASIAFNHDIQVHNCATEYKSAIVSWPEITLTASNAQTSASTVITFNNRMTNGVDPTYDAGLLRGSNGLSVFTRLVEDNGVDFAIQCLPEVYDSLVIAVGLESRISGLITFSFEQSGLENCVVMLEDRQLGIMKTIKTPEDIYTASVESGQPAYGRFFLRFGKTTSSEKNSIRPIKAWYTGGEIIIEGMVDPDARAELYDIHGRKLFDTRLEYSYRNSIPVTGLKAGIYLVHVVSDGKQQVIKVAVK
jgi:hypothetical protein